MFYDFAPRLARIITEYSVPIQPGDRVVINSSLEAQPFLLALQAAILRRGGHVHWLVAPPGSGEQFFRLASDAQLDYFDRSILTLLENCDVFIGVRAASNTRVFSQVPPEKMVRSHKASKPFSDLYQERVDAGNIRWVVTGWPTNALAQQADMGLLDLTELMYNAAALDQPDPLQHWHQMRERQDRLIEWLDGKSDVHVIGPGVDLRLSVAGRTWVNACGLKNFPDGEIFTSPVEDSATGTIAYNLPSMYLGREVAGVRFTFKDGRVVAATADKNEDYLISQLDLDDGARTLGEFAIGTNDGINTFTGEILFDEKMGRTIHTAVGLGIEQAGGTNKSQVHWDMVHHMEASEIYVDGDLFYKNGEFVAALD